MSFWKLQQGNAIDVFTALGHSRTILHAILVIDEPKVYNEYF